MVEFVSDFGPGGGVKLQRGFYMGIVFGEDFGVFPWSWLKFANWSYESLRTRGYVWYSRYYLKLCEAHLLLLILLMVWCKPGWDTL